MRARMIKPEFFSDPQLGRMPDGARILFIGLWTLADREGRLVDSPLMIAGSIWPYRDDGIIDDVRRWLELLAAADYILRYEIDGSRYIQIRTFKRHQPIHPHEKASRIPPPPQQSNDNAARCPGNVITSSGQCTGDDATLPSQRSDNVPLLLTSYLLPLPAAARKLPNTPLPPTTESPPLKPVENPVEISPGASRVSGNGESPPLNDPRQAIAILAERRAMEPRQRRAPPPPSDEAGLAIAVVSRMLRDWMEHRADALGPPDEALCRRLLEAHQMSLERLRDWLLGLRRRGKHPGSVQSWGWFVALAESKAGCHSRASAHAAS